MNGSSERAAKREKFIALCFALLALRFALPSHADNLLPSTTDHALTLIDPELTNSVAAPPAKLPEPPPQVRLPAVVAKSGEWKGPQCGVTEPRVAVFRHDDKWKVFWDKGMVPYLPPRLAQVPTVDFAKDMVVGIFLGDRRDPHYSVEIRSIKTVQRPEGPALEVRYREIHMMAGVFNPEFTVQPFHLKRISAFNGPVEFIELKR